MLKIGAGIVALVVLVLILEGSILGGGGGTDLPGSIARSGSVPTATPPANLPDPIVLSAAAGSGPSSTTGVSTGTYVVKDGDTLSTIAIGLNVPSEQQAAWIAQVLSLNSIQDARLLRVGQELTLPAAPRATVTPTSPAGTSATPRSGSTATPPASVTGTPRPAASASPTPTRPAGSSGATYTVQAGDYPQLIAQKCNLAEAQQAAWAEQLLSLNGVTATGLQVGQVLNLPPGGSGC